MFVRGGLLQSSKGGVQILRLYRKRRDTSRVQFKNRIYKKGGRLFGTFGIYSIVSKEDKNKEVEVNVQLLQIINDSMNPLRYRTESLIGDYHKEKIKISESDLAALYEFASSAQLLSVMLTEYLTQAQEHGVEKLYIPLSEYTIILSASKSVDMAYRTALAGVPLWTH